MLSCTGVSGLSDEGVFSAAPGVYAMRVLGVVDVASMAVALAQQKVEPIICANVDSFTAQIATHRQAS